MTATTPHTTLFHRILRKLWTLFVVLLVLAAVAISLVRVLFPELGTFREDVERLASEALGHPVRISEFDARLVGLTPTFIFRDIRLVDEEGREMLRFDEARIGLAVIASLLDMKAVPDEVTVAGLDLSIVRRKDGTLSLEGIELGALPAGTPGNGGGTDVAEWLFSRTHLELTDSTILWRDALRGREVLRFSKVRVVLRSSGKRHLFDGSFEPPPGYGARAAFAVDLEGDIRDPDSWEGAFWASSKDLSLDKLEDYIQAEVALPSAGRTGFEIWGDFSHGGFDSVEGRLTIEELALRPARGEVVTFPDLETLFAVRRRNDGWRLDIADLRIRRGVDVWPPMAFTLIYDPRAAREVEQLRLWAEVLPLGRLAEVLARSGLLDDAQGEMLAALAPGGRLESVYLSLPSPGGERKQGRTPFELSAVLRDVEVQAWKKFPGVRRLSARLWTSAERGWLRIEPQATELRFASLFREPLPIDELDASLRWFHHADEWHLVTDRLRVRNADLTMRAALRLVIPADPRASYLDLQARFRNARVAAASRYLPTGIMKPKLVKWLDTALVGGTAREGTVIYNGRLNDFPFHKGGGLFRVEHDVQDLKLLYQQGWPAIEAASGTAWFSGTGFGIDLAAGRLQGNTILGARVGMEDYRRPLLSVDARVRGSTRHMLAFLSHSPIARPAHDFVDGIETAGSAEASFNMQLPLNPAMRKAHPLRYAGRVALAKAAFHLFDGRLNATNLNGAILFSEQGQRSEDLNGLVFGQPARFSVYSTHIDGLRRDHVAVSASAQLDLLAQRLDLPAFRARRQRVSLQANYTFGTRRRGHYAPPQLVVTTDLPPGTVALPAPLDDLREPLPVVFEAVLGSRRPVAEEDGVIGFGLYLGNRINAWGEFHHRDARLVPLRGTLHFGAGAPVPPEDEVFRVTGSVARLDLRGWMNLLRRESGSTAPPPLLPIRIDMGEVNLLTASPDADTAPEPGPKVEREWTPRDFPAIDARIGKLRLDGKDLGVARLRLEHTGSGIRLAEFRLASDVMTITGQGDWRRRFGRQDTTLHFSTRSNNVGDMFRRLGYTAIIEQGEGQVDLTLYWPDALTRFSWEKASGTAVIDLANGNIVEVDPGAGRLLGLLSLSALPRRLFLDFRDFSKGFRFDSITGRFNIREGNAYTDGDLVVKGTVGTVQLRGRTGLAARDFDSTLTVIPGATDVAAGGLAIFSDPVSGVALWLLNKLTGSSFDRGLASEYRITGSWKEPVIERVSVEPEEAEPEAAPAAGPDAGPGEAPAVTDPDDDDS